VIDDAIGAGEDVGGEAPVDRDLGGGAEAAAGALPAEGGLGVPVAGDGGPGVAVLALDLEVAGAGAEVVARVGAAEADDDVLAGLGGLGRGEDDVAELLEGAEDRVGEDAGGVGDDGEDLDELVVAEVEGTPVSAAGMPAVRASATRANSCCQAARVQGPNCVKAPS
jgi:hypothetical protein